MIKNILFQNKFQFLFIMIKKKSFNERIEILK